MGLARAVARNTERAAESWAKAVCDRGDFAEYAELRAEIGRLEAASARARKDDRRAETLSALLELRPGDIINVPSGRYAGWVLVVDPGLGNTREGPKPLVMTTERQLKLSLIHI